MAEKFENGFQGVEEQDKLPYGEVLSKKDIKSIEEKQKEYSNKIKKSELENTIKENYSIVYYEQLKNFPDIAFDNIINDFFEYKSSQKILKEQYGTLNAISGKILKELGLKNLINQLGKDNIKILKDEGTKRLNEFNEEIYKLRTDKKFQNKEFPKTKNYKNLSLQKQVENRINKIEKMKAEIQDFLTFLNEIE